MPVKLQQLLRDTVDPIYKWLPINFVGIKISPTKVFELIIQKQFLLSKISSY